MSAELLACKTFDDLLSIDPDARFASRLANEAAITTSEVEAQVLTMYRRYATEVEAFFERARPILAPRPRGHHKENERDLFAAAG